MLRRKKNFKTLFCHVMETRLKLVHDSMSTTTGLNDMAGGTHPATKLYNVVPRPMRRLMVIQFAIGGILILIWVHYNGGLLPQFVRNQIPMLKVGPDISPLAYFSQVKDDASKITWERGVNSKAALDKALHSKAMMLECDVILQHVNGDTQKLLPVLADPPKIDSDITLDQWLDRVVRYNTGIKLDFHSIDAVEISLQKLKFRKADLIRPVWLSADVLSGPHATVPPIDPTRFLRTVHQQFPECTLALGWKTGHHTDLSLSGYSWRMVMDMYQLVSNWELKQPLTFNVRLSLMRNSVPQLKWLCDVTGGSLTVWHGTGDVPVVADLMYIAYKFRPNKVYFDLDHEYLQHQLELYRHRSQEKLDPLVLQRDSVVIRPEAWVKMGFWREERSILPSTEAVVLLTPNVHMVSKFKYQPTDRLRLVGRVQFLKHTDVEADKETGLHIFFRTIKYDTPDDIRGIRCFIGEMGTVKVEGWNVGGREEFKDRVGMTPSNVRCYRFAIINALGYINIAVNVLHDCNTLDSVQPDDFNPADLTVRLPGGLPRGELPIVIKAADRKRAIVIDELTVQYSNNGKF